MMHAWGFAGGGFGGSQRFEEQYHCYALCNTDKAGLEKGDKIILPPSAFDTLARLSVDYPMLFQLSGNDGKTTHSGVLEFSAEEGCVYAPEWILRDNLRVADGGLITVTNISLPKAEFCLLQPQSAAFVYELSNAKAVLEHELRGFSCVTAGDTIPISYNNKVYSILIQEVKPSPAACIIETDCRVEFTEAPDAAEYEAKHVRNQAAAPAMEAPPMDVAADDDDDEEDKKPAGTRIVNGEIVRPEDEVLAPLPATVSTGSTGVQPNAAIPQVAPDLDYWASCSGSSGQRLDGKQVAAIVVDKEEDKTNGNSSLPADGGIRLNGKAVDSNSSAAAPAARPKQRQARVGSKYSRLAKSSAFQGSAQRMHKK